jgi:hypothetical protein
MKIRKTFLEQIELIQMNPSSEPGQLSLPFKGKKDDEDSWQLSIKGNPEILSIYKKLREISDNPKEVEKLKELSFQRGVDRKLFDQMRKEIEDQKQPLLNAQMKKMKVASVNQLRDDIKKIDDQFKKLKTDLTLKNLYKQSLRTIISKFFTIPGMKMPRRYLMLPMSYSSTLNDINELNSSENKYEKMFKILKNQIVVQPEKIDEEIKNYLERYDYQFKDFETEFYNNICYTKNGAEIKITDEFEKIKGQSENISNKRQSLEKAPADKRQFIEKEIKKLEEFKTDYLNRTLSFISEAGTGMGDQSVVVITWVPRLILTQSTGTPWTSCQNLLTGGQRESVLTGAQEGVFIAWLVGLKNVNDIRKPKARILIKPFLPKNKGGKKEIIWWSSTVYSESGGNFGLFKKVVNSFLYQKQQKIIDMRKGVSKTVATLSGKKNMYEKGTRNLYRIYPDREVGFNPEQENFAKIIADKRHHVDQLFNAHDFDMNVFMNFLKKMNDKEFNKYSINNSLMVNSLTNNMPVIFNYVIQRIKNYDIEEIKKHCFICFDQGDSQTITKIYINFLNELYRINGDKFFEVYGYFNLYDMFKNNQLINVFLKEKIGMDFLNKVPLKIVIKTYSNSLVSEDIKKSVLVLIKNKFSSTTMDDLVSSFSDTVIGKNKEIYKLHHDKITEKFNDFNDFDKSPVENYFVSLMQSVNDISNNYSMKKEDIEKSLVFVLEILLNLLTKKSNFIKLVVDTDEDMLTYYLESFIENCSASNIKKIMEVKGLNKEAKRIFDDMINKVMDSPSDYNDFLFKFKEKEEIDFFMKINKETIIAIAYFLEEFFNLPMDDLESEENKKGLQVTKAFVDYLDDNKSVLNMFKQKVEFDDNLAFKIFGRSQSAYMPKLVKNLDNPLIKKLMMFFISCLKKDEYIYNILANITLFFAKGNENVMMWYVNEISKLIKKPKEIKKIIHNLEFSNLEVRIADTVGDYMELSENLPSLLKETLGLNITNLDLFLKTFQLEMSDIIDIVMKEINVGDTNSLFTTSNRASMHYLFQYDEFKQKLEETKIKTQAELNVAMVDLITLGNGKKYMSEDEIKRLDFLNFYLRTKNNLPKFKKSVNLFTPGNEFGSVYNLLAIFYKDIKVKDIIYDNDLKNIFNMLDKKYTKKVLDDLKITYEKKDIDSIYA